MRSWGGGIVVYRSYALYEEEKTYNVLKGTIPDFDYDVKLAVTIDDKESKTIPDRGLYKVNVTCKDASTTGEWDYNAWNVKLENASNGSKCKIAFTTNGLTQKEYQN